MFKLKSEDGGISLVEHSRQKEKQGQRLEAGKSLEYLRNRARIVWLKYGM